MGNKENWRQNFHTWILPTKDLEVRMATLNASLQYLEFLTKKTEALLVEGNQEALNRQLRALKVQEEKYQNDRILVEAKMFQEKSSQRL